MRSDMSRGFWVIVLVGSIVFLGVCLSFEHWEWLNQKEDPSATIRNIGLVIAAPVALVLAVWRSVVAEEQVDTTRRTLREGSFQKAADMLGSDLLSVRLGGIYGLSRLARDYPKEYHISVVDLLAAFVRHPPPIPVGPSSDSEDVPPHTSTHREAVQTILEFLSGRTAEGLKLEKDARYTINLIGSDLRLVNFPPGSNLEGFDLKFTNLMGAFFDKVQGLTVEQLCGAYCEFPQTSDQEKFEAEQPIFEDTYDAKSGKSLDGLVLRRGAKARLPPTSV